jgi:anti-sigma-K factor RskA
VNDELRDLAALVALGAASDDDVRRLEDAAAADPALAAELAADLAAVTALRDVAASGPPPDGLVERVLLTARAEDALAASPRRRPARSRLRRLVPVAAAALAAALAAVGVTAVLTRESGPGPAVATAQVVAHDSPTPINGTATLHGSDRPDGLLVLDLADVPPAPSGHHYEVWVLRADATEMEAVGTFAPTDDSLRLELPLPGSGDYAAMDISLEEDGGPPEHSGTSIAGGAFGPAQA